MNKAVKDVSPEVQSLLQQWQLSQALHALPKTGGLNDQDTFTMLGFLIVQAAVQEKQEIESKKKK